MSEKVQERKKMRSKKHERKRENEIALLLNLAIKEARFVRQRMNIYARSQVSTKLYIAFVCMLHAAQSILYSLNAVFHSKLFC